METKAEKKKKSNAPISRKPSGMIDEKGKLKIVEVVKSGRLAVLVLVLRMWQNHSEYTLVEFCALFGVSRQAIVEQDRKDN
jgi:hypothetical protein